MKICVLGGGGWGTALSILLLKNGHDVTLWFHTPEKAQMARMLGSNLALEGIALPKELNLTGDISVVGGAELAVFVTPSFALRQTAELAMPHIRPRTVLVSATKGIEANTDCCMTQILQTVIGKDCPVAALSGPSHAEEVSRGLPTGCIAACEDWHTAKIVQDVFMGPMFRVYTNQDVMGVELCGALKNIVAICCGMVDGLELGDNCKALLMTRAMVEIANLCEAAGGSRHTCSGLAGVGDLIVTCMSRHSRNHRAGVYIGRGTAPRQALEKVGAVVEGYYAAESARNMALRLGVEMPICGCMYEILYEGASVRKVVSDLMNRDKKSEFVFSET